MSTIAEVVGKSFSATGKEFIQYVQRGDIITLPVLGIRGVIEITRNSKVWKVKGLKGEGIMFFVHHHNSYLGTDYCYEVATEDGPILGDTLGEAVARGLLAGA